MGWVSYLEDVNERLIRDLDAVRVELTEEGSRPNADLERRLRSLLSTCDDAVARISEHLEIADDPRFDMAFEITQLDREKAELRQVVEALEFRRGQLRDEIERLQSEGRGLRQQVRDRERRLQLAHAEMNRLLTEHPDVAFDLYSTEPNDG